MKEKSPKVCMQHRDYKITGEGEYFHIYNRGNNRQNVFLDEEDYEFFLLRLRQNMFPDASAKRIRTLPEGSFSLLSYCLMPNHFHLLIRQNKKYPIQQLMLRLITSYSKYFNKKHERTGHVFQDRFKQVHAQGEEQLLWLHSYINLNPAIDTSNLDMGTYRWSSYGEMVGLLDGWCDKEFIMAKLGGTQHIKKFFDDSLHVLRLNKKMRKHLGI